MRAKYLQPLLEAAIMAALSLILDLLPSIQIGPFISIDFAMVPVLLVSIRWGFKYGIISGFIWGLLQVVTGDIDPLHWFQVFIEYFVAFSFVGFAGLFKNVIQNKFAEGKKVVGIVFVILATLVGSIARYIWHYYAGIVFWGSYAPEGQPAWLYSLIVNGTDFLGSFLFSAFVLGFMLSVSTRLLTENRKDA